MYYYSGRSGDSFTDATIHTDAACCGDPVRPVAEDSVEATKRVTFCPDCANGDDGMHERDKAQLVQVGVCPWCDRDGLESVGRHAAQAHPEEWQDYKSD